MSNDGIRSFRIEIPQAEIDYLHDRLASARWPGELPGVGWTRGIPLGYLTELAGYWHTRHDWRAAEVRLNSYALFTAEIDGQAVHFLHVQSGQPGAKPLLIAHGFPSTVAEFLHLIEPLVTPAAGQAFHVAAPSLPGYAFSTPLSATGWTMGRTARARAEPMRRLGYQRYGVHGGDISAGVSGTVAGLDGDHVIGVHVATHPLTAANTATFLPGMADRLADPGFSRPGTRRCRPDEPWSKGHDALPRLPDTSGRAPEDSRRAPGGRRPARRDGPSDSRAL